MQIEHNVYPTPYWIDGLCIPIADIYSQEDHREDADVEWEVYNEWRMFSD